MLEDGVLMGQSPKPAALAVRLEVDARRGPESGCLSIEIDPLLLLSFVKQTASDEGSLLASALGGMKSVDVTFSLVLSASSLSRLISQEPMREFLRSKGIRVDRAQIERTLIVIDWESSSGPGRTVLIAQIDASGKRLEIRIDPTSIGLSTTSWPPELVAALPRCSCEGSRLSLDLSQFNSVELEWPPAAGRLKLRGSMSAILPFLRFYL